MTIYDIPTDPGSTDAVRFETPTPAQLELAKVRYALDRMSFAQRKAVRDELREGATAAAAVALAATSGERA